MNRLFHGWAPWKGEIPGRRNGALISNDKGKSTAYALWNLEERGAMFIADGEDVYEGMIIGENSRGEDLDVNPLKGKKLTNVRASGKDETIRLTPPRRLTLEQAIAWIEDGELVEVTPAAIRLRKAYLDPNERKRQPRAKEAGFQPLAWLVAEPRASEDPRSILTLRHRHVHALAPLLAMSSDLGRDIHRLRARVLNFAHLIGAGHFSRVATDRAQHRIRRRAPPENARRAVLRINRHVLRHQLSQRARFAALHEHGLIAIVKPDLVTIFADPDIGVGQAGIVTQRTLRRRTAKHAERKHRSQSKLLHHPPLWWRSFQPEVAPSAA